MTDNKLTKSAGEHWVCAVLSRLGWAAALTRDGIARTDILAVHENGRHVSIQVKTSSPAKAPRFVTGSKCLAPAVATNEYFVLVVLSSIEWGSPNAFVVPRDHLAAAVWIEHQEWLTNPTAPAGKRNTPITGARTSARVFARYEQRWDLLDQPTDRLPVLLPPRFRALSRDPRVLLPPNHSWTNAKPVWDVSSTDPAWSEWLATEP
jgi:hypothetical protein